MNLLLWTLLALGSGTLVSLYSFSPGSGENMDLAQDPAELKMDLSQADAAGADAYQYMRKRHTQAASAPDTVKSRVKQWRLHGVGVKPSPYALIQLGGELLTFKPGDAIQPGIVLEQVDEDMIILNTPEGPLSVPLFQ